MDVWIILILCGFAIFAIPFMCLCCCFRKFWVKEVWLAWYTGGLFLALLWHLLGSEWRSGKYWSEGDNGNMQAFSSWTSTYATSSNTLIVVPSDEEELRYSVLKYAQYKAPIRVVGSGHSWSATGYTDGTIIDIRKLNNVIRFSNHTITVQAGMKVQDAVQFLMSKKLCLYGIGSIRAQAIGGVVSQGVHGPHPDGLNRHVVGMRVLLANGEFRELISESDLFMWRSSMGMLGVIVHVTFKVFPLVWLRFERSAINGIDDLDALDKHLDVAGGRATTFTGFLYPSRCSKAFGWKRVGYFLDPINNEMKNKANEIELKNQSDFGSRLQLHFNDHMHPAMQYLSYGVLGTAVSCLEQMLATSGHSTLLSGPNEDVLPNDGLLPPFYEIIDYEYMIPLRHCTTFARELMIHNKFGRVLIPVCLRLMRAENSCMTIANEDSCVFGIESMRGMAYTLDVIAMEKRVSELGGQAHFGKVAPGNFKYYKYPCLARFQYLRKQLDPKNIFLTPFLAHVIREHAKVEAEFRPVTKTRNFSVHKTIFYSFLSWIVIVFTLYCAWSKLIQNHLKSKFYLQLYNHQYFSYMI